MSDEHSEASNPIASLIGIIFMIAITVALVTMLTITGFAFVGAVEPDEVVEDVPATIAAAAPATQEAGGDNAAAPVAPAAGGAVDLMALGKKAYATCAACHGPNGKGVDAGPAKMAPSLLGSEMLLGDPDIPLLIVLKGIQKENMNHLGMMAGLGAALDDEKMAAVLTYTRNEWGNKADPVTVEQAAAARAKFADVNAPAGVKRSEVLKIVEAHK